MGTQRRKQGLTQGACRLPSIHYLIPVARLAQCVDGCLKVFCRRCSGLSHADILQRGGAPSIELETQTEKEDGGKMAYSFLDLAFDVLKKSEKPLTYQEVWQVGQDMGLASRIGTAGKTPWQSLGAQLYVDVRDNDSSKFIKVGKRPARFFLKERSKEITPEVKAGIDRPEEQPPKSTSGYKERELHPVLTYFASAIPTFNRGREVVTKTIYHEKAKKSGYSEWTYPDMVGFSIPL